LLDQRFELRSVLHAVPTSHGFHRVQSNPVCNSFPPKVDEVPFLQILQAAAGDVSAGNVDISRILGRSRDGRNKLARLR
jgi:hypothetical protein